MRTVFKTSYDADINLVRHPAQAGWYLALLVLSVVLPFLLGTFWLGEIAYAVPRLLRAKPLLLTWGVRDRAFPRRFIERYRQENRTGKRKIKPFTERNRKLVLD